MKYVKMLGLAAVAAAALMAFVGASSASATVLCKTDPTAGPGETTGTVCPAGWAYAAGQEVHAVNVGNVTLDTSFKTITCTGSTVKGTTSAEEAEPLTGPEGTLSFSGCNCTVNVIKAGTLTIRWISGTHNGTVFSHKSQVTTICTVLGFPVHCTYVTEETHIGTLIGSTTSPTLVASAHIPVDEANSDGACPEESTWTATYTVTTPNPLAVAGHT